MSIARKLMGVTKSGSGVDWTDPDLTNASYDSLSFDPSSQDGSPDGLFFKPDGTKMYIAGSQNDAVFQYSLSTPWVISSATYDSVSLDASSQQTFLNDLFFKPDGSKLFVVGNSPDGVHEYDLSTAWDVSSGSYNGTFFDVASETTLTTGLFFKPDGAKMYVSSNSADSIFEYDLSTAWDVSSAVYSQGGSTAPTSTFPSELFFNPNGDKVFVSNRATGAVQEFDLTVPWDISTISYSSIELDVSAEETRPQALFFKNDGSKLYIVGLGDIVYQYSTA